MSDREDFNAWLKTWALPGNTSREDAMYAAWQARAARTAPAEQAEGTTSDKYRAELYDEVWQKARDMGYGNVTDALAGVERLKRVEHELRTALKVANEHTKQLIEARDDRVAERLAVLDGLRDENERLKQFEAAYMEWSDKTDWARSIVDTKDLGKHLADIVREKFERLRKDRKSCWEEFKALVKSSKEREGELKAENERLREEVERLKEELEENNSDAAVAAIKYALEHWTEDPVTFLKCWMDGDFSSIREEWDEVPDEVFIGADPLFKRTAKPEVDHE